MRLNVKPYEKLNPNYCLKTLNFNVYEKYQTCSENIFMI